MSADEGITEAPRGSSNHVQGYIVHSSPTIPYSHHQLSGGPPPTSLQLHAGAGPSFSVRPGGPNSAELLVRAGHPLPLGSQTSLGIPQGGATLVRNPSNLVFPVSQESLRNKPPNIYHHDIRQQLPPP